MNLSAHHHALARTALFGAAIFWGSSFFIMKNVVSVFPANYLMAIRFSIATLLLGIIFHKRLRGNLNASAFKAGALVGFTLFLGYFAQTVGLTGTTPGKNAFLTAVYCVIVPFLYWFVNKTRPDAYSIVAAFLCIAGIGLVSLTSDLTISAGDGLTLLCGFFFACNIVAVAQCGKKMDVIVLTILQFGFAALCCWICGFLFETWPAVVPTSSLWELAYLSVIVTAVAFLFQNIGIKWENPSAASIILSLEAVFGVLFSVLFYGEALTPRLCLGFIIIFCAVILSETKLAFLPFGVKKRTDP